MILLRASNILYELYDEIQIITTSINKIELTKFKVDVDSTELHTLNLYLDKDNYVVANPTYNEKSIGSHAMAIVGYDLEMKHVIAKNSFGTDWGLNGYCHIPFDYVQSQCFEQWIFDIATPKVLTS